MQMHRSAQSICEQIHHELWHEKARSTVNELMLQSAVTSQALDQLKHGQENLRDITKDTYETTKSFKTEALLAHETLKNSTVVIISDVEKIEGNQKQALASQEALMQSFTRAQKDVQNFHQNISLVLGQYDVLLQRLYTLTESVFQLEQISLQYYHEWHSVFFYALSVPICLLFTSTRRTVSARPLVLITLTVNLLLEWTISYLVVSQNLAYSCGIACTVATISGLSRRILVSIELLLVCRAVWIYVDETSLTRAKLLQLERTTQLILKELRDNGMANHTFLMQENNVQLPKSSGSDSDAESEYVEQRASESDMEITDGDDSDSGTSICSDVSDLHQSECHYSGGYTLRSREKLNRNFPEVYVNPCLEFETSKDFTEMWVATQKEEMSEANSVDATFDDDCCFDEEEHF